MVFIDAHSHLSEASILFEAEALISAAKSAGVRDFFLAGFDPGDWQRQRDLRLRFGNEHLHCVFGMHPWWVARTENETVLELGFRELEEVLPEAAALGELGLDFYPRKFGPETHARQIEWFKRQLDLALRYEKPLVLHVVSAHEKVLEILHARLDSRSEVMGIVHGFSGNVTIAEAYVKLGLTLSIGNGALKKGYENVKRAIKQIDLRHWVLESDAPDQLRPADVARVARAVADLKGLAIEEVARITTENALRSYRLA